VILIADSGSTKTQWRCIENNGNTYSFSTAGFNPFFWTSEEIYSEIKKKFPENIKHLRTEIKQIFFYGAGCSNKNRNQIVHNALSKHFPKSKIEVEHDLLGAARAICGRKKGIACILGTGSNSCLYDGKKITKQIGGMGYILGDEGSGAHIGLTFIKTLLNDELPKTIRKSFFQKYRVSRDEIIESVYNKKHPNRFLATYTKFIHTHIDEAILHSIVLSCFRQFFEKHICKYENYKNVRAGFVGSIAFHFKDILMKVAREKNVLIGKIIENPIDELVKYHLNS
jgi:N-acetylglucosamine kinase-like BadF-type ATPase